MSHSTIELAITNGVAALTLNRPEAANAMNLELAQDLMEAALRCDEDQAVRAVLISGRGAMFCGGGDLKAFADRGDEPEHADRSTPDQGQHGDEPEREASPFGAVAAGRHGTCRDDDHGKGDDDEQQDERRRKGHPPAPENPARAGSQRAESYRSRSCWSSDRGCLALA